MKFLARPILQLTSIVALVSGFSPGAPADYSSPESAWESVIETMLHELPGQAERRGKDSDAMLPFFLNNVTVASSGAVPIQTTQLGSMLDGVTHYRVVPG